MTSSSAAVRTAVILAAGRGSRMGGLTSGRPKCLLTLAGRTLLDWQLRALRRGGIEEIHVVRGYRGHDLSGNFRVIDNPRWEQTNMVRTLLCAANVLRRQPAVIAYADIVYRAAHVQAAASSRERLALTYDTDWESLWRLRFGDPLLDAETFAEQNGLLQTIGGRPASIAEIGGQYMGLLKVTPEGFARIEDFIGSLPAAEGDALDMTSLLAVMLAGGERIGAVPVAGGWLEADTPEDLSLYEKALRSEGFSHDFRDEA